jgi:hypothetical protein
MDPAALDQKILETPIILPGRRRNVALAPEPAPDISRELARGDDPVTIRIGFAGKPGA